MITPWSVSNGPRDTRDELPSGGGQVYQSGAPLITPNAAPAGNQYHYTGPAASNPYFTTPSNPLREGYVLGFDKWFEQGFVSNPQLGGAPFAMNPLMTANEDGANEALRLIRMFEPNARLESSTFGSGGGPYLADRSINIAAASRMSNFFDFRKAFLPVFSLIVSRKSSSGMVRGVFMA